MATTINIEPLERQRMRSLTTSVAVVLALGIWTSAGAQAAPAPAAQPMAHAHPPVPAIPAPQVDIPVNAQAVVEIVERFGRSLAAGDLKTAESLLDPDVLILETGGAERSRREYMGHHAISDAKFLNGTRSELKRRRARIDGGLAWVGTESELHASKPGKPPTMLSTETMVLKKTGAGWRIVHIHWSSRPKKGA